MACLIRVQLLYFCDRQFVSDEHRLLSSLDAGLQRQEVGETA